MLSRSSRSRAGSADSMAGIVSRNPREAVGIFAAAAAMTMIVVNALFLQPGPHPAPIFMSLPASPGPHVLPVARPAAAPLPVPAPAQKQKPVPTPQVPPRPAASEVVRSDPIAALLAPSKRVLAVQRMLSDYGYGQIKPTGVAGPETQDAIKKFERSHKLPVTGMVSDELVHALAQMSGQTLE